MQDPDKLCDNCNHGQAHCFFGCEYFLIKDLYKKYPEETEGLYKKIRKNTFKMIRSQKDEDCFEEEDDGED